MPFLLTVALGLEGSDYGSVLPGELGIAAWAIVFLGSVAGVLSSRELTREAWAGFAIITALAVWTGLGISWSESAERSVIELARIAAFLGVFVLALTLQRRGTLAPAVAGVASGVVVIGSVALLSRLLPLLFPVLETPELIEGSRARLHYPLDYWNGLAALIAMGIPLLLAGATYFSRVSARALCLAFVPALGLAVYFTLSRGAVLELAVALVVLFASHPRRGQLAVPVAVALTGSAALIAAASWRPELMDGLDTQTAVNQGYEMLAISVVVCALSGAILVALGMWTRRRTVAMPTIQRPPRAVLAGALVASLAVLVATGAPGELADGWESFKDPDVPAAEAARFDASSGSGRYQWWSAAIDANSTDPILGIGPGTFEYWWAREGSLPVFVRDAHSLYLETLGELGIVGLLLLLGVMASPFVAGIRMLPRVPAGERILIAGALAGCSAFVVAAAFEWVWELAVIPVAFLLLGAALLGRPHEVEGRESASRRSRLALAAAAVCGLVVIAVPLAGTHALRDSQAEFRAQNLPAALQEANAAISIQPYSASAYIQKALVLELAGDYAEAAEAARSATEKEPTNWRTWLVLSRLAARTGDAEASLAAYREAQSLNPRSVLFQ